jgi:hypothetical protein
MIASTATLSSKELTIEDPQIVNGLQTSTELFKYFRDNGNKHDHRSVLVRVIVPTVAEVRDRIIKATNSQTSIPPASLRATEKIHRDIEEFLRAHGLFYDRRKNFYKNEGKPIERIVSIPLLAQAVMAIVLQRPNDARARPSSLLKKNTDYETVFSPKHPIQLYLYCATILKSVEAFLRSGLAALDERDRNNIRFYLVMCVAALMTGKSNPSPADLAALGGETPTPEQLNTSFQTVSRDYTALGATDQAAKSSAMAEAVRKSIGEYLASE